MQVFDIIAILIFLSGLFIFINVSFLKLPSSIGLMILALTLSLLVLVVGHLVPGLHLAQHIKKYDFAEVLYQFVLSVMLFSGALNVNFKKLGSQVVPVVVLAVVGVLISTLLVGTLTYGMISMMSIDLDLMGCLVFGALISSTDPMAVTRTIRRFSLSRNLERKITGESLLNGGVAIVLALTLVNIHKEMTMYGGAFDMYEASWILIRDIGGGLAIGLMFGWLGFALLRYIDNDHVQVEVLITLALVMTGALVAELLFVSPAMVAVITGLMVGNLSSSDVEDSSVNSYVFKFWKLMEETIAAMLFVLIGFEMLVIPLRLDYFSAGFFAVIIVLFSRWVSVYVPIRIMSLSRSFDEGTISVLAWGALRGGLPVAVSLSLAGFPGQEIIVTMTYMVVVASVLYQGFTLNTLMKMYHESRFMKVKQ